MSNLTTKVVSAGFVATTVGAAVLTGGASLLIGSAVAGVAAAGAHHLAVGGVYAEAEDRLRREMSSLDKSEKDKAKELSAALDHAAGDRCLMKMATVAVGVGTFICPPAGLAAGAALIIGAIWRRR